MQTLQRNAFTVWYQVYAGQVEIEDEYGNPTGSFADTYGPLQSAQLMVSPNKGDATLEVFGTLLDYDRVMSTADTTCPIDEQTILWLDGAPTTGSYTHYVKQRAPWKYSLVFDVKKEEGLRGANTEHD